MKKINKKILLLFNLGLCGIAIIVNFILLIGATTDIKDRIIALLCTVVLFFYVFRNLLYYISEEKEKKKKDT